jgi:hypothetical protein
MKLPAHLAKRVATAAGVILATRAVKQVIKTVAGSGKLSPTKRFR